MTTGHVFVATSLDGFIARKNNALDWLPQEKTEGEDLGYETFVSNVDGLIMGRGTFEKILTFGDWPFHDLLPLLWSTNQVGRLRSRIQACSVSVDLPLNRLRSHISIFG